MQPSAYSNYCTPPDYVKRSITTTYVLYLVAIFVWLFLIVGVIWAYRKRREAVGTMYYDHYQYLIITFWYTFLLPIAGFMLFMLSMMIEDKKWQVIEMGGAMLSMAMMIIPLIWFIYRSIAGWLKFHRGQNVSPTTLF